MYICPGCGYSSKRGLGNECSKCDYQVPDMIRFPSIDELLNNKEEARGKWNDVNLVEYTRSVVDYLINSGQIKINIKLNSDEST